MIYTLLLIYLIIVLPLSVLMWTALVAAKWGDEKKEKRIRRSL
jgi:hypothetical protein